MPKTYTFRESIELLRTNYKTFHHWLETAHINAEAQKNSYDPRKKYLTRAQLEQLAHVHGRDLPPLEEETPAITFETIMDRLTTLEQQQQQQFATLEHLLSQALAVMEDSTHGGTSQEPPVAIKVGAKHHLSEEKQEEKQQEVAAPQESGTAATVASPPPPSPPAKARSTPTKRKKKAKRGKHLPRTYIPLRIFAEQHHISLYAAQQAGKHQQIAIQHGRWLYQSRYIAEALGPDGQQEFFQHFSSHEHFRSCEDCPHST